MIADEDKLSAIIERLCLGNKAKFARMVNASPQTVTNWFNRGISKDGMLAISQAFPDINSDWLLYGEGEMLKQAEGNAVYLGRADKAQGDGLVQVRYFEVTPSATFQEFCSNATEIPSVISVRPERGEALDDTYCVFEVCGESMAPQIQPGAKVLCQEIPPTRWHTLSGCVVAIAYADRFAIKRVADNDLGSGSSMTLASDNPDYPARETVALADIRAIFKARRIISSQIH